MSLVRIARDPVLVSDPRLVHLLTDIRQIVADALTIPGTDGELHSHEIEMEVRDFGSFDQPGKYSLEITVLANEYPERRANLDERREKIIAGVKDALPNFPPGRGYVWVLLMPGSFGEF